MFYILQLFKLKTEGEKCAENLIFKVIKLKIFAYPGLAYIILDLEQPEPGAPLLGFAKSLNINFHIIAISVFIDDVDILFVCLFLHFLR